MTAPACPRLAAELTSKILDAKFTDEISLTAYKAYIWMMQVLLSGGWINPTLGDFPDFMKLVDELKMRQVLTPWLVPDPFSQEAIDALLVDRALFDTPAS